MGGGLNSPQNRLCGGSIPKPWTAEDTGDGLISAGVIRWCRGEHDHYWVATRNGG